MAVYCENCKHYKGDGEKCVDDLTIGMSGIPLKHCDGYESMGRKQASLFDYLEKKRADE